LPISIVHPKSFIEPTATVGKGCQFMPLSVLHKFTQIGDQCLLNTHCTVDHECILGNGVHVMGNAAIAGKVTIGDFATVGTNATILPYLTIGEGAFVGAGAVVTRNVEPYSVVAGVPAVEIRKNHLQFDEELAKLLVSS
jgi:sugar O-acyltransferase (sialic acid O-acetyltransferase NeuD family)